MPNFVTVRRVVTATAALLLAACSGSTMQSEGLEPQEIFQRYQVHYDKASDQTLIQADFFQNSPAGIPLELSGRMAVTVNGVRLERPTDFAPYYKKTLPGFVATHEFVFTHRDGSEEAHAITIEPVAPLPPPPVDQVLRGMGPRAFDWVRGLPVEPLRSYVAPTETSRTFHWDGVPVRENETIYLIIENALGTITRPAQFNPSTPGSPTTPPTTTGAVSQAGRTAKYFSVETPGDVGVTLSEKDLVAIGAGQRTLKFQRMTRLKETVVDESGAERTRVTLSASYVSETKTIQFGDRNPPAKR